MKSIIINKQAKLSLDNNNLVIKNADGEFRECLDMVSLIIINNRCEITTPLLINAGEKGISIIICDSKKNPSAIFHSYYGTINQFELVSKQIRWSSQQKIKVSFNIIKNKLLNQEKIIFELFGIKNAYSNYISSLNYYNMNKNEAFVARKYFYKLFGSDFNRRDKNNEINACLNYGYSILSSLITKEIISHGYLTCFGINHHSKSNNYNFTYDLIEPFRAIVDFYVFNHKNCRFDYKYKKEILNILYVPVKINDSTYTVINCIKEYVLLILNSLNGKGENVYLELL